MPKAHRHGITMVELLVVIAIIAVLIGLLTAGVQTVRNTSLRTQCANNLSNLGLAYRNWKGAHDKAFPALSWPSETCPYIESDTKNLSSVYRCPLDDRPYSFTSSDPTMYIAIWINSRSTPAIFKDYGGSNIVAIVKNGSRSRQSTAIPVPPGSPPGSWVAEFELTYDTNGGGGGGLDWNDLGLLMSPQPNGSTKVTFIYGDGSATAQVGDNEIMDLLDQNKNPVASNMKYGDYAIIPGDGLGTSYGINGRADYLSFESTKILLLEYQSTVARVVNPSPLNSELYLYTNSADPKHPYAAARHKGLMNVLFADGHIEAKTVADVDPNNSANQASYWAP